MRIMVQKFGGSSLGCHELRQRVVRHVLAAQGEGYNPVVVVSAMGGKGEPYATDTLLELMRNVTPAPPPRETDLLISCGELIAAAILAVQITGAGADAVALAGWQAGIITDGVFGQAEIVRIKKDRILKLAAEGKIVVVAGVQGVSEQGDINTLGRGGSDTTAVALAAALESEWVEIYSDEDPVMTADPRFVPEARPIRNIGYEEVLQMAREGAKVVHPRAVDIAMQFNLPLLLKKTGENSSGTLVTHKKTHDEKDFIPKERVVSAITHVGGLAQIRMLEPQARGNELEEMLRKLAKSGISIDLISFSPQEKMFTVKDEEAGKAAETLKAAGYRAVIGTGFAKVSVVGSGMRGIPGVMARVVTALSRAGAEILQTADSHLSISCLIPEKDVGDTLKSLHLEFGLAKNNSDLLS
ncbi:MAG: aspartate kinase [Dethiobacter sp.]|nr:aspartate kinase [Dethiobacter sp.]